ncbi:hypothetical protein A2Z33_00770 [Candidatus Gottesmanbacteria bacterium RBG_16_52_11]|uniref:Phage holin family protein n=1 Tax=Candidatus Gottesmanbacteria bacterium RBG_16_52_11 TaxID=1798374 RepID=A0A1F5YNR7_9BACT|nr:MAG: hypothetical protein A2Z33_00770 [Candidatus Gottesmanbacteria bacterium RBG_16_52_11]
MKHFVRVFLFTVFAIWLSSQLLPALVIIGNWQTILIAGFVLAILMIFVAPLLKILFIPINIITFGLLSWMVNVIILYFLTILMPEVVIRPWTFPGISYAGFAVPPVYLSYPVALITASFVITLITNLLHSVSEQ